jgi:hypothetical protein
MKKIILQALGAGAFVTLGLFGFAYLAVARGNVELSYYFYWQGAWLESLVPCENIGHALFEVCKLTNWHIVAFYGGIPLGMLVYGAIAFVIMLGVNRIRTRRGA